MKTLAASALQSTIIIIMAFASLLFCMYFLFFLNSAGDYPIISQFAAFAFGTLTFYVILPPTVSSSFPKLIKSFKSLLIPEEKSILELLIQSKTLIISTSIIMFVSICFVFASPKYCNQVGNLIHQKFQELLVANQKTLKK